MLTDIDEYSRRLARRSVSLYLYPNALLDNESSKRYNKKVIVLDRPNPIGEGQEGLWLSSDFLPCRLTAIALRHGYTIGELATAFRKDFPCELEIIKMQTMTLGAFLIKQTVLGYFHRQICQA